MSTPGTFEDVLQTSIIVNTGTYKSNSLKSLKPHSGGGSTIWAPMSCAPKYAYNDSVTTYHVQQHVARLEYNCFWNICYINKYTRTHTSYYIHIKRYKNKYIYIYNLTKVFVNNVVRLKTVHSYSQAFYLDNV